MARLKRYAVTLALVLLAAAALTTYYAYGANLRLPEYRLQTLEGDPAEAAGLTLSGSFVGGKGSYSVDVTTEGSEYGNESLWDRLLEADNDWVKRDYPEFGSLYREHPQFMRGKMNLDGFYQDKDWLIYADAGVMQQDQHLVWSIESLDTATGKRAHYEGVGAVPKDKITYADIVDVQKAGDEVHVLVNCGRLNGGAEYFDEVFEAATGKPVRSVKLKLGTPSAPDRELRIDGIADASLIAPNPQAVLIVREETSDTADSSLAAEGAAAERPIATAVPSDQLPKTLSKRAYAYDYATGELREFPLPVQKEENGLDQWTNYTLEGNELSILNKSNDAVTVTRCDLATGRAEPAATVQAERIGTGEFSNAILAKGRLYMLMLKTADDVPIASVADAADGRILYKGQPVCIDSNGRPDNQLDDVWLLNLSVQR